MSYSLNIICDWLSHANMKYRLDSSNHTGVPIVIVHTGVSVKLNDHLYINIETSPHPFDAGVYFAVSRLKNKDGIVASKELKYTESGPSVFSEPKYLFEHLTEVRERMEELGPSYGQDLKVISNDNDNNDNDSDNNSHRNYEDDAPSPKRRKTEEYSDGSSTEPYNADEPNEGDEL